MKASNLHYCFPLFLFLCCGLLRVQAQTGNVGIGNNAPTAKLHVTGNARITNMPPGADADSVVTSDVDGNLRKRPASAFGGGGANGPGSAGATLDSITGSSPFGLLLVARRGTDYLYNGGSGWSNNAWTTFDWDTEDADPQNTFDINTNEFIAPATGLYFLQAFVGGNAVPNPALNPADGGNIAIRIQATSNGTDWTTVSSSELNRVVNANVSGGLNYFASTCTGAIVLRTGEKARIQFLTYGTGNFNNWNLNRTGLNIIRVR